MVTLGPPAAPFIMGFVAYHTGGWQWIYRIFAIVGFFPPSLLTAFII
jgi:hypothetical protein